MADLWEPEHAAVVRRGLSRRGYPHAHHLERGEHGQTGLFVAARKPLTAEGFRPFSIGGLPRSVWHLDWLVEKGVARHTLPTPLGDVLVLNTHL